METPEEALKNVVPFRPVGEPRTPVLTPVENSAFNELARQLSARLESENGAPEATVRGLLRPQRTKLPATSPNRRTG